MNILLALLLPFGLSFLLTPLFRLIARRLKIMDYPGAGKMHNCPTALLGGAAIFLSFLIVILLTLQNYGVMYRALYIAGTIIFISGLVDDKKPLSPVARLIIQIAASIILVGSGIYFTFLPNVLWGKSAEVILTVIWIVGITNAFNCLDGLNGLAAGVAIIGAVFFFIFASVTGQSALAFVLIIIIGACSGFFPFNFFKGSIFLGSAGSTWLGFTLAGLAVIGEWATGNPIDLVIPVLIFGVPIFDMSTVTIGRILDKKAKNMVELLGYRGKDHFHHRLSRIGFGNKRAVFFIYTLSIMLGLNALLLQLSQGFVNLIIILCVSVLFFIHISLLMAAPLHKIEGAVK